MNVRFEDPFRETITASDTACGTVTVTDPDAGGGGGSGGGGDDGSNGGSPPDMGGIGLPDDPAVLGGVGLLALLLVAYLVI